MEKYSIFFMTEDDGFEIELQPANEEMRVIFLDLLSCFGEIKKDCLKLALEQQATAELKSKITTFVEYYSKAYPVINQLKSKILHLPDDQYFLILKDIPSDTAVKLKYEVYISTLNEVGNTKEITEKFKDKIKSFDEFLVDLLSKYDMNIPRNDRRTIIGNTKKENRCCRFCGKTSKDEVKFNLIRKDHQPNTENPLKSNLSGVIVKHLP